MTWRNPGIRSTCLISLVLLLGLTSTIIHSSGVNWTSRSTGSAEDIIDLLDLTSNGSLYVAIGSNGIILTSPDTITWTSRTSNTTNELRSVVWNGTQFVIAGEGGIVLTSPDGITWTTQTTNVTYRLNSIVWNGALFVAVGQKPATVDTDDPGTGSVETSVILIGAILTSPDAITWTEQNPDLDTDASIFAPPSRIQDIMWDGTQFVAVAAPRMFWDETGLQFLAANDGGIITSTDAVTWEGQTSETTNTLRAITRNNSLFVAVGAKGTILTSPDEQTWTTAASGATKTLSAVSWNGTVFVAVGENGTILTSLDGTDWTAQTSGTNEWLQSIYWDGAQFSIVGTNDTVLASTGDDPDLSISASASSASVLEGETVSYTLIITNNGAVTATGVTVGSALPSTAEVTSVSSSSGSCTESNSTITCNLGALSAAASETVTAVATLSAPGTVANSSTVVANESEPNLIDNSVVISTTVGSLLDINNPETTSGGAIGLWFLGVMTCWCLIALRRR